MKQQTFIVPKFWDRYLKFSVVFCGGMLVLSLLLPILDEKSEVSTMILGVITFGLLFFMSIKTVKELPYSTLVIDEEGIWYKHLGKENGLVPWSKIARLRDRQLLQRLELLDDNGNVLIKAEHQLENMAKLRDIIASKTTPNPLLLQTKKLKKDNTFHLSVVGFIAVAIATAIFLYIIAPKLLFLLGILVLLTGFSYLTMVIKVSITEQHFVLHFPLGKKIIPFSAINHIATTSSHNFFQIGLFVDGRKRPYRLTQLGVDDRELLMILRKAAGLTH